jgi:hypothetical protein
VRGKLGSAAAAGIAVAVAVAVAVTMWVRPAGPPGPNTDAAGLFPAAVAGIETAESPRRLLTAWASTPAARAFDIDVPARPGRSQEFFVNCDHGYITLDFGGSTPGIACSGSARGVIGNPYGPDRKVHVHVVVNGPQDRRWGVAVYTAP